MIDLYFRFQFNSDAHEWMVRGTEGWEGGSCGCVICASPTHALLSLVFASTHSEFHILP